MRRKISLYIGDQLVDLDDQSFILFNYTMDDLSNPTIVKNSFSQQITLKGTPANNKIFGGSFRADRRVAGMGADTGIDYNASQKTPFTIYNEMGEILESGYVKLDAVSVKGADIQYKITLYGGLGSFFYALSYDVNGNKRTLADLDYLGTSNPDTELNFAITKEAVKHAWDCLHQGLGEISESDRVSSANLMTDGSVVSTSLSDRYVSTFPVMGSASYLVDCVKIETSHSLSGVVAFDANGDVVAHWYDADGAGALIAGGEITMPSDAAYIKVQGVTGRKDAGLRRVANMWDIINFAPAYNGIPDGNFSPDKALIDPAEVGLPASITKDAVEYTTKSGYTLVSLARAHDEWAVKDLRSYLQRPVLSMKAFWDAICNPANNGGYEVDASVIRAADLGKYASLWMTLPLIPSLGTIQKQTGDLSVSMYSSPSSGNEIGRYDLVGSVPAGSDITANLNCMVRFNMPLGADSYNRLSSSVTYRDGRNVYGKFSVVFLQAVAYASDDTIVGGSKIKVIGGGVSTAAACGFVPVVDAEFEPVAASDFVKVSSQVFEIPASLAFSVTAQGVAYYKIHMSVYPATSYLYEGGGAPTSYQYYGSGATSTPDMYVDYDTSYLPYSTFIVSTGEDSVTYTSSENLRSGATITKSMLLSSSRTPAEYMISFCKIFGLYFTYDVATRKVKIYKRNDLYQDETIDLSRRIDRSRGISFNPLVFTSKWYDFVLEGVGGAFYDEYLDAEGIPYGIQRVNTGYDFNADAVNLLDSVVFKNACTTLGRSRYFNYIFTNGHFQPSPFLDKGNKFTLWSADGETLDTDISCPLASSSVTYYNTDPNYPGYDINTARKLELRTADNTPVGGAEVLVFLEGWNSYPYFKLTDDIQAMDTLNDGVPCWLLGAGASGDNALSIPSFQRYSWDGNEISDSLDFGIPREFDIPGIGHQEGCTIYDRAWRKYLSDRYDVNSKVMSCFVDFGGMMVNRELLRKFYWYDNSLWVLNKIRNHSLTTYDPVECEFVQVQDKGNYLNGQTY